MTGFTLVSQGIRGHLSELGCQGVTSMSQGSQAVTSVSWGHQGVQIKHFWEKHSGWTV